MSLLLICMPIPSPSPVPSPPVPPLTRSPPLFFFCQQSNRCHQSVARTQLAAGDSAGRRRWWNNARTLRVFNGLGLFSIDFNATSHKLTVNGRHKICTIPNKAKKDEYKIDRAPNI